jgi:phospholipid/cholesterol/gamma-HCH transport system substrate-binding protein
MGGRPITAREVLVAALFTLSCILGILYVWDRFGGTLPLRPHGWVFHSYFDQAANLADNEDVRVAGVKVGRVISVSPSSGLTDAKMELGAKYAPLPLDTHAILRSKTLLGENYVELTFGSPTAPKLSEYGYLPYRQVAATQQVDQVLGAFDAPTRAALKQFLADFSSALDGEGTSLNGAVADAAPAVTDLQQTVAILDRQGADVQRLVNASGVALRAIAGNSGALQSLVTSGDQVLGATAARNRALTQTVGALPPLLAQLRPALEQVQATSQDAAPTLHALAPVAPLVAPALSQADTLAPTLTRLFHALPATTASVRRGVPAATDVVGSVKTLSGALDAAGRQLVPVIQFAVKYIHDLISTSANLGAATEGTVTDPNGSTQHYARVLVPLISEGIVGVTSRSPTSRANPYPAPGAYGLLQSFDCRNTANPPGFPVFPGAANPGAPPCVTAQPWSFQGASRSYPQVQPFAP